MARKRTPSQAPAPTGAFSIPRLKRWALRAALVPPVLLMLLIGLYRFVNPPLTHTIWAESRAHGGVERVDVAMHRIAPVLMRSVVAAEDANFCRHWGFDMDAIRQALDDGGRRGASTLTQQTVKNVFLWQGRSWLRKALEALITPVVELAWPKRRILELYLSLAEFGPGVFGVEAAAQHHFGTSAALISARQAALLAAVLPDPKGRDAANPSEALRARALRIADGAATIAGDGRAACFED